jgi:hypothetical protein
MLITSGAIRNDGIHLENGKIDANKIKNNHKKINYFLGLKT